MENMVTNFRLSFGDLVLTQASHQPVAVKEPVFAKDGDYGYYGYSPHFPFTIDGNALRRWRAVRRGGGRVRFARYLSFGTHHSGFGGHTGRIGAPANFNRLNPGGNRRKSSCISINLLIRVNL